MKNKLFKPAPLNFESQNAIAGGSYSQEYTYISGYYWAAEIVANSAIHESTTRTIYINRHELFYPICFNYRHFLELSIKRFIKLLETYYRILVNIGDEKFDTELKSVESELESTHSLEELYKWMVERLDLVSDLQIDDSIRKIIKQFHDIDSKGQVFRYSNTRNGRPSLPQVGLYDLENLRKSMKQVHDYFSGLETLLDENGQTALSYLQEIQQGNMGDIEIND